MPNRNYKELKNNKKDIILRAAEEEFIQKGYDGARMVEIAKRAGVGHPLLHYHFSNKRMLFQQVVKSKFNILSQTMRVLFEEKDRDLNDCIRLMVSSHFDFVQRHCNYIRFIINELEMHPELFQDGKGLAIEQFHTASVKFQKALDSAEAAGKICKVDAETLLLDILSLNVFSLWTKPLLNNFSGKWDEASFFEARKSENVKMILGRLQLKGDINTEE